MLIPLNEISDYGLNIDKTVSSVELGLTDDIFKCLSPLLIKARLEKAEDAILAKAEVSAEYELSCARCLEPIVQKRTDQFDLFFEVTPETDKIDFGEEIRQELVINLSGIMLCQKDCQGICQDCGINLNNDTCNCAKTEKQESGILKSDQSS